MSPDPITRRRALELGLAGAGGLTISLVGLKVAGWPPFVGSVASSDGDDAPTGLGDDPWREPDVLTSANGALDLDLRVAAVDVSVAGAAATMLTYNGTVPGPTLHVRPGDRLRVHLVNDLDEPTNLHTHGLVVSPQGSSDNPFVRVEAGERFDYTIDLPADHPSGVFWYHPHHHGMVADQVFGGLYGAIVVDRDDWGTNPPRVVVVSDVTVESGRVASVSGIERMQGRVGRTLLTNGAVAPALTAQAGSTQRLLVVNACTSRYLDLDLDGRPMRVRGIDGGRYMDAHERDRLVLAPGNRADFEVEVPSTGVALTARGYDRGAMSPGMGAGRSRETAVDTTVLVLGPAGSAGSVARSAEVVAPADLRGVRTAGSRTLDFTMGMGGGMRFLIDGRTFDPDRVDQEVRLGDVEEWTLRNLTGMDHPFHLHVWPMQVLRVAGEDVAEVEVRDVVDVPAGEEVVVRVSFDRFGGRTVYHCHILDHEDLGMMGVIEAR